MSKEAGWKALNMEFTNKVPRTEFSAHQHWELVQKVTGIDTSLKENYEKAADEFVRQWNYDFMWSIAIARQVMSKGRKTSLGHAEYASGGTDYNDNVSCPFEDIEDVYTLDATKEYGEFNQQEIIDIFQNNYSNLSTRFPNCLNTSGIYITMVSGLLEIFGWDAFLMALGSDAERFNKVVDSYFHWIKQFFDAYAKTDIPVMMIHDDIVWTSGPFTSPQWYRENIFPKYKKLWTPIKEAGKKIIFTSDGTYTEFFDDIVECGADMLVMEPSSDMGLFAEKYGKTHGFVGNADCRILLNGTKEDIYKEVERCMDIGKKYPGFIMAVGNHIPSNTPVDNALYYNDAYEKFSKR